MFKTPKGDIFSAGTIYIYIYRDITYLKIGVRVRITVGQVNGVAVVGKRDIECERVLLPLVVVAAIRNFARSCLIANDNARLSDIITGPDAYQASWFR